MSCGLVCARSITAAGVPGEDAVRAQAFAALAALAAAGQRLVPLGGVATQRALWRAGDAIDEAVARSATVDPAEPCSFVPEIDVRSAQHERQRVRLFIS
jgi:urease accessory protein